MIYQYKTEILPVIEISFKMLSPEKFPVEKFVCLCYTFLGGENYNKSNVRKVTGAAT